MNKQQQKEENKKKRITWGFKPTTRIRKSKNKENKKYDWRKDYDSFS